MPTQEFPAINGQKHSFADVILKLAGVDLRGCTSINYKSKRGMTDAHGTGPNRVGVALGKVTHEGSLEMYREDFQRLITILGNGYSAVPFPILVIYRARIGAPLIRDTLNGCRIMEPDTSPQEGDDPVKVKTSLNIGDILWNGLRIA